jgi:hypothetical protein
VEEYHFEEDQDGVTVSMVWNGAISTRKIRLYNDGVGILFDLMNHQVVQAEYIYKNSKVENALFLKLGDETFKQESDEEELQETNSLDNILQP